MFSLRSSDCKDLPGAEGIGLDVTAGAILVVVAGIAAALTVLSVEIWRKPERIPLEDKIAKAYEEMNGIPLGLAEKNLIKMKCEVQRRRLRQ